MNNNPSHARSIPASPPETAPFRGIPRVPLISFLLAAAAVGLLACLAAKGASDYLWEALAVLFSALLGALPIFDRCIRRSQRAAQELLRELEESQQRFRTLTELSSDWYWEQDEAFRFTFVSAPAFQILGRGTDYVVGKCRWELPTDEIEGGWEAHKAELEAHRPFRNVIVRRLDSNRKLHVLSISGTPVFDAKGRFKGYRGVTREITEQELAHEALRESERRVRMATEYAEIGIWERDLSTEVFRWSPNIGAMLGRPAKTSTTPTEFVSFVHPDDRERYVLARSAWMEGDRTFEIEHRIVWPDGTSRWVQQRGALERAEDGRPVRTLGVIQDITERRHAESVLRESEEKFRLLAEKVLQSETRFRALTELSSDWYWEQDENLRFTYFSGPAYAYAHETTRRCIGKTRWEISHLATPEGGWAAHKATLERREPFRDFILRRTEDDGALRTVSLCGAPVFDEVGCFRGYRGVARDITEQVRASDAIRRSGERIRQLAEGINKGFWFSEDGPAHLVYVSPAFERMWGMPAERLYADPEARMGCVHPDDQVRVQASFHSWSGDTGAERCDLEYRLVGEDGEIRWIQDRGTRTGVSMDGKFQFSGFTEDITERKLHEQHRIEDALRQRDALVREVHHRVKNTLQGLVGLLRRHAMHASFPSDLLDMAVAQVQSVAIVHGLQGKRSHGGIALYEMLEAMARMHEGLSDRHVDLEQAPQRANAILLAEPNAVAVALILNEIISNAVKHTDAEAVDATVRVQLECAAERARVRVRNRGRLPHGFDHARGKRLGTGLRLVRTMVPHDGMCMAFAQDGEIVDVQIDLTAPVVVSVDREASSEGE